MKKSLPLWEVKEIRPSSEIVVSRLGFYHQSKQAVRNHYIQCCTTKHYVVGRSRIVVECLDNIARNHLWYTRWQSARWAMDITLHALSFIAVIVSAVFFFIGRISPTMPAAIAILLSFLPLADSIASHYIKEPSLERIDTLPIRHMGKLSAPQPRRAV